MCAYSNYNENKVYPINYAAPGTCIIFNNKFFKDKNMERKGSEKDVMRITQVFQDLNFAVETCLDKKASEIRKLIRHYANLDYTNEHCFICFIMSHGNKGTITSADLNEIYLNEFIDPFKQNKTLKNKPKLFFIQACRGTQEMNNLVSDQKDGDANDDDLYDSEASRVPIEADFLFCYSTVEGYYSYRNPESGSWYIQTLCDVITKDMDEELSHMLIDVNSLLSKREKMMPTFENRLTKRFYLIEKESAKSTMPIKSLNSQVNRMKISSSNVENTCEKGISHMNLTKYNEAIKCFDDAILAKADYADAHFNKGRCFMGLDKSDKSIVCFDKALKLNPSFLSAYNFKGFSLKQLKQNEEAKQMFVKANELNPNPCDKDGFVNKGLSLEGLRKFNLANQFYDKAIQSDPDAHVYCLKGLCLWDLGKKEQTLECFDSAIRLNCNLGKAYSYKASLLKQLQRYDDAITCLNKLLQINPQNGLAYKEKGIILKKLNRHDDSIECFDIAIEIEPDNHLFYYEKALCLSSRNVKVAIEYLDKSLKILSNYEDAFALKAAILCDNKEYKACIECCDTFLRKNSNCTNSTIYAVKADSLSNLRRPRDALEWIEKALCLDPDDESFREIRNRIIQEIENL